MSFACIPFKIADRKYKATITAVDEFDGTKFIADVFSTDDGVLLFTLRDPISAQSTLDRVFYRIKLFRFVPYGAE